MLGSAGTTKTFPGNLLREQSGEMAARPLLINLPLKFHRVLLIIEGLMLRPSCAPQFLAGTPCGYLTVGCGMHGCPALLAASASGEERKGTKLLVVKIALVVVKMTKMPVNISLTREELLGKTGRVLAQHNCVLTPPPVNA